MPKVAPVNLTDSYIVVLKREQAGNKTQSAVMRFATPPQKKFSSAYTPKVIIAYKKSKK